MNERLKDQCLQYLGAPPYNTSTNVVWRDPYFLIQLEQLWGKETVKKALGEITSEILKESIKGLI